MEIKPFNYDDITDDPFSVPSPSGPFQDMLSKIVNSILARAKEAETLIRGISALINKQNSENSHARLIVK
ncbi:hypothetical protein HI914_05313 [Erysiphe necator]|nr:hypothetical protein HI914_05313 [Erysiphe necator]